MSIPEGIPRAVPSPGCCFSKGKVKGWVSVPECDFGVAQPGAHVPETPSTANAAGLRGAGELLDRLHPTLPVPSTPVSCAPSPVYRWLVIKKRCVTQPLRWLFGGGPQHARRAHLGGL